MKRMIDDKELSRDQYGNVCINEGMSVSDNGDVTIGRDLHVEDEIVISHISKIVDVDGEALFNFSNTLTAGTYGIELVVDSQGKCTLQLSNR